MERLMIASDIHGSAFYCRALLEAFEREQAGRLLLLGDLLYHGPRNDLPKDYAPKEVMAMLNGMKTKIYCVRGNCDGEVDQMVLEFPIMAEYFLLETGSAAGTGQENAVVTGAENTAGTGKENTAEAGKENAAGGRLVFATHGHHFNLKSLPPLQPGDILLHGHTHVPAWTPFGEDNYYLNPGSVSMPKEGSRHGYMMLENGVFTWKDLSGATYHTLSV